MTFEPNCLATGIGSLPHDDMAAAIELIARAIPHIPYVPQLPALGWHEGMMVQYTEGLPGLVLDEEREKFHMDLVARGVEELEGFYMRVIEDDPAAFAISEDHFHGVPALAAWIADGGRQHAALKTQVTGPVTQGLSTVDQDKRAIFYEPTFQEVLVKNCGLKARWLVRQLKAHHDTVLCFVDEPILSAFGSSVYVSVERADVVAQLREVGDAIRSEGALCGVHCCGNTDWTLLIEAGVDVLSFDAYEFAFSLPLYPEQVVGYLERDGIVAWGVVPTQAEALEAATVESLHERLEEAMDGVAKLGVPSDRLRRQALITPACGLGSVNQPLAERAFELLHDLSAKMRAAQA